MVAEVAAGEGASGFLPPVPTSSAAEGPPCTYYREQRSNGRYDLFATTFPHQRSVVAPPRRLPVGSLDKHVKCTVLPALASIDPLLSSQPEAGEEAGGHTGGTKARAAVKQGTHGDADLEDKRGSFLPGLEARRSLAEQEQGLSRIYPGRCASTTLGSNQMPVPSDDEFRGWLTPLPPRDGTLSRQELMSPGRQGLDRTLPPAPGSSLSMSNISEECDRGASAWLVMLMRSTYENPQLTPQHVAIILANVLGVALQEAEQKSRDAQVRLFAVLQHFEDRSECFSQLRALRRSGLVVQVVTEGGIPHAGHSASSKPSDGHGDGGSKKLKRGASTARNYGEVFNRSLYGTNSNFLPRLPPSARAKPRRIGAGRWRGEAAEVAIDVLPEDPVEAFFSAEGDRLRQAAEQEKVMRDSLLAPRPALKKEASPEPLTLQGFPGLVRRHRATIKKNADITIQTSDEQDRVGSSQSTRNPSKDGPEKNPSNIAAWEGVLDAVVPKTKIPPARKEACQMMRFFVYGCIGNETARTGRESEKVFYQAIGTKEEVMAIFKMWQHFDQDGSGRVDIVEFRMFAEQNMREKLEALLVQPTVPTPKKSFRRSLTARTTTTIVHPPPAWSRISSPEEIPEFVSRLCSKLGQLLLGKKSSFTMEDMMRLVWPCAQQKELKTMRTWCKDFRDSADMRRVKTPPLLPQADYQGLCSVFEYFDEDRSGTIRLEDLVSKGLIYEEQAPAYFKQWDRNGDGLLDLLEFCEMMCPIGYRAHRDCPSGSLQDGTRVVLDRQLKFWRVAEEFEEVLVTMHQ